MRMSLIRSISADLWVFGVPKSTKSLGTTASIQYAVGNAQGTEDWLSHPSFADCVTGTINTASVQFLGYNISDQAYRMFYSLLSEPTNLIVTLI